MAEPMQSATLDHVVIDARDRMDEAARIFQALGFQLTPRGYHTLGSINHLAMFGTNYLELLGFGANGNARAELAAFPVGLNGLVFKAADADRVFLHAQHEGVPILPVNAFSRPVELDRQRHDARFRTTRLPPDASGIGRVYFCEHQTPELVWRPAWQAHPNGAQEIKNVLVASQDPARQVALFRKLFGPHAVTEHADGSAELALGGGGTVALASHAAVMAQLSGAAPDPAGRESFMAALTIRSASLPLTTDKLRGLPGLVVAPHRVTVPAAAAMNTAILFEDL